MLLTSKIEFGVPQKNHFTISFTEEEKVWMAKNRCRIVLAEAKRFPGSDTFEFHYTLHGSGHGKFYCKPENFFTELYRVFHRHSVEEININAVLPDFWDEFE